jgi:hypothetical protein
MTEIAEKKRSQAAPTGASLVSRRAAKLLEEAGRLRQVEDVREPVDVRSGSCLRSRGVFAPHPRRAQVEGALTGRGAGCQRPRPTWVRHSAQAA